MELKIHDEEIYLQKFWKSGKVSGSNLRTLSGSQVEIFYVGRENEDAGPDFKEAVIKLDGRILRGDIEVHLNAAGWYEHGHHTDPAYNNVIMHVISEAATEDKFIEREDGVKVNQIFVEVENSQKALWKKQAAKQLAKPNLIVEHCPLHRKSEAKILATINTAGELRLSEKSAQMQEDLLNVSWDQLIYKKILEALGYSKNQTPFRKLADLLPYETVCGEMHWVSEAMAKKKCAAMLFGTAGLLPSQSNSTNASVDTETLDYVGPLEYLWQQISHHLELKSMQPSEWQFFRLRPQNFPTRRIAGLVHLLHKFYRHGFLEGFLRIIHGNAMDLNRLATELEQSLIVKAHGFWLQHYTFQESQDGNRKHAALIGKERARDIVVNIIIPVIYLYSTETEAGFVKNIVREVFTTYPKLAENAITKAMKKQLFGGHTTGSNMMNTAFQQQGLIYLHKLYCKTLRCSECLNLGV